MRLLNTHTGRFEEKDLGEVDYAILSHTWEGEEQTFQQVQDIQEAYDDDGDLLRSTGHVLPPILHRTTKAFTALTTGV